MADQGIEFRMRLGRRFRRVALDEGPEQILVVGERDTDEIEEQREGERHPCWRNVAGMDVVNRIAEALFPGLARIGGEELLIFVDRLGDDAEGELLRLRSEEHTSELQSLMRISYAVFCLKKKKYLTYNTIYNIYIPLLSTIYL